MSRATENQIDVPSGNTSLLDGFAESLLTSAWVFASRDHFSPRLGAAVVFAIGGLLVLTWNTVQFHRSDRPPSNEGQIRDRSVTTGSWAMFAKAALRTLSLALLALLILASVDQAMAAWEARSPWFDVFSVVSAPVLSLVGYPAASVQGMLQVKHADGLISIVPSMEKVGVRWFVELWFLWVALRLCRARRRWFDASAIGVFVLAAIAEVRYLAILLIYLEHDNILVAGRGQEALDLFSRHYTIVPFLVVGSMLLGLLARRLSFRVADHTEVTTKEHIDQRMPVVPGRARRVWVGLAATCFVAGLAWSFKPPGRDRLGRVLIDDRFCGVWEPAARLLDTEWYGDFPTYSFNSLAEWLGHWFSVDVNPSRPYDDDLLARYDILVIKTPVKPIPDTEREAIGRFVRTGGGLLLVGDHTNLLGMGTHLNSLCAQHGIRFRYDSVSTGATGGFSDYSAPTIGRSIASLHVEQLQFMTSCSLAIEPRAEAVLVAGDSLREPHDYANSSFFGRHGPHPELEYGRATLAATVRVGDGRITAFTDSTVWSSFAVFTHNREKLAMDILRQLNREPSRIEQPLHVAAVVTTVGAFCLLVVLIRTNAFITAMLVALLSGWGGVATSEVLHHRIYRVPAPKEPVREVVFLWKGGACAFPPVLGSLGSLPVERAFDTLFVSVQRMGLVPRIAYTYDADLLTDNTRAVVVVAPVDHPPRDVLDRLKSFVQSGGRMIVIDDSQFDSRGSAADFLGVFEVAIAYHHSHEPDGTVLPHAHVSGGVSPVQVPSGETFVATKPYGNGHVVYMRDAAGFSRKGMGHCFARPWTSAKEKHHTVFLLFRDVLSLAPDDRRYYGIL